MSNANPAGRRLGKTLTLVLVAVMLAESAGVTPLAQDLPDLHVLWLRFHPSRPAFWSPVTVEVVVENAGGPSFDESSVSLEWCCGEVSRPLPTLSSGESVAVTFKRSLVFTEPGGYEITATVDPDGLVAEGDETNNGATETISVTLRSEPARAAEPADWFAESTDLVCPDVDLMRIGRREPYAMQDLCPDEWGFCVREGDLCPDGDGDGIVDADDACANQPGPAGSDGCPVSGTATDQDGDGLDDSADHCAAQWGDIGSNGCPRPDGDGDGRLDGEDACPLEPGPASKDGCPTWGCPMRDMDGDGVYDDPVWRKEDGCPSEPGPGDNGGCPVTGTATDQDGDGVDDSVDDCPQQWGFLGTPGTGNGCPIPDSDGDGIPDADDACPEEPGPGASTGCPVDGGAGDADGDCIPDGVLARLGIVDPFGPIDDGTCDLEDDEERDLGCQVYLRGQRTSGCGVTSLAYTLRYFGEECCGEPCHPDCVDEDIRMFGYVDMFTDPISIKKYAESKGLNAEIYVDGSLDEVRWFVDQGIPVLVQIIATANSANVMEGHYVVPVAFCELEEGSSPGTTQTFVTLYEPNGWQIVTTPERLEQFWGEVELPGRPNVSAPFHLWNRLYIAISDRPLPPGNTEDVAAQLAIAQAISNFMVGAQNFSDAFAEGEAQRLLEGLVEMGGGVVTAILGLISSALSRNADMPILGGFYKTMGDIGADVALTLQDIINGVADLLNPETWIDPARLLQTIGDVLVAIGEGIVELAKDLWNFVVDGIGGFFKDLGCDWFGAGCPETIITYKHYASPDACLESSVYINGMARVEAVGYVHTQPVAGTVPVYLFAHAPGPTLREFFLCSDPNWVHPIKPSVRVGLVGHALATDPGTALDLTAWATSNGMMCGAGGSLGYLAPQPEPGATLLWHVMALENQAHAVTTDACAGTETFVTPIVEGYSRETVVGLISASEMEGLTRLYRLYDPGSEDCMLTTSLPSGGGFKREFENEDGLAVGDVDADGRDEIVHADRDDWIQIFDGEGNAIQGFGLDFENGDGLAVGDVTGNGLADIVHGDRDDHIRFYDVDGRPLGGFDLDFDDGDRLAVGDVDGDGVDEIIHGDRSDKIRILEKDGTRLAVYDLDFENGDGLAAGDVNGDGLAEIIHGDRDDKIRVLDTAGTRLSLFDLDFQSGDGLAAGDVNGDGIDEIIHGDRDDWIRVLAMDGTRVERFGIDFQSDDGLAAGDVNGDGIDEIVHADRDDYIRTNPGVEGYVNHGYLGYIHTGQQPGTVPLYQHYNPDSRDHYVSVDPAPPPDELGTYTVREVLGYVVPPSDAQPEDWTCNVPLWRYCKQVRRQED